MPTDTRIKLECFILKYCWNCDNSEKKSSRNQLGILFAYCMGVLNFMHKFPNTTRNNRVQRFKNRFNEQNIVTPVEEVMKAPKRSLNPMTLSDFSGVFAIFFVGMVLILAFFPYELRKEKR